MGTVADKLQAVLDSKNAIRDKFNLDNDLPFSLYADTLSPEPGEYYKCVEIDGLIWRGYAMKKDLTLLTFDGVIVRTSLVPEAAGRYTKGEYGFYWNENGFYISSATGSYGIYYPQGRLFCYSQSVPDPDYGIPDGTWVLTDGNAAAIVVYPDRLGYEEYVQSSELSEFALIEGAVIEVGKYYTKDGLYEAAWFRNVDVSATTATAEDVKQGKQFYDADGTLTQGTNDDVDVSATTATAADVAEGKQFYDAEGTLTQGTLVPQSSGGGSATYYKCAEVGLPEEVVEMPEPVFSVPLTAQSDTAETGQALTYSGNVTFQEIDGVQCAYFDGNASYIDSDNTTGLSSGASARSLIYRIRLTQFNDNSAVSYGTNAASQRYGSGVDLNGNVCIWGAGNTATFTSYTIELNKWYFITTVFENDTAKLYINGAYIEQVTHSGLNTINAGLSIGKEADVIPNVFFNGYLADVQIYNTALTADEVMKLCDPSYVPPEALEPYTWTGYKAYLVEDTENNKTYYDFETELTTDTLTWGSGFTPAVDSVYDATALVKVVLTTKLPIDGLAFYAPLTANANTAETGQLLTISGNITYQEVDGVQCAYFDGSSYIGVDGLYNDGDFTESMWLKTAADASYSYMIAFHQYTDGANYWGIVSRSDKLIYGGRDGDDSRAVFSSELDPCEWHHVCLVKNGGNWQIYIDGQLNNESSFEFSPLSSSTRYYGRDLWGDFGRVSWNGYMAGVRNYNRALSADEVAILAREFSVSGE